MDIRILVVEDDEDICKTVTAYLMKAGYHVDSCFNGDDALERFYDNAYQLVILDILLPGTDGHELLKEFRKLSNAPVLMMTALDDNANEICAFNNEADDYITKPFAFEILLKRVEALLRRSGVLQKELCVGQLMLFPESGKTEYDGSEIPLTSKEFDILMLLIQNKGKFISQESLMTRIWGYDFEGTEGAIHVAIKRLRNKFPVSIIKTVKGFGYTLEDDI